MDVGTIIIIVIAIISLAVKYGGNKKAAANKNAKRPGVPTAQRTSDKPVTTQEGFADLLRVLDINAPSARQSDRIAPEESVEGSDVRPVPQRPEVSTTSGVAQGFTSIKLPKEPKRAKQAKQAKQGKQVRGYQEMAERKILPRYLSEMTQSQMRKAVLMAEILDKPVSLKPRRALR